MDPFLPVVTYYLSGGNGGDVCGVTAVTALGVPFGAPLSFPLHCCVSLQRGRAVAAELEVPRLAQLSPSRLLFPVCCVSVDRVCRLLAHGQG